MTTHKAWLPLVLGWQLWGITKWLPVFCFCPIWRIVKMRDGGKRNAKENAEVTTNKSLSVWKMSLSGQVSEAVGQIHSHYLSVTFSLGDFCSWRVLLCLSSVPRKKVRNMIYWYKQYLIIQVFPLNVDLDLKEWGVYNVHKWNKATFHSPSELLPHLKQQLPDWEWGFVFALR